MNETNTDHSLATYVSDMIALEKHVVTPVTAHVDHDDFKAYPQASSLVSRVKTTLEAHISSLQPHLDRLGGHQASGLKDAVAGATGAAAAAIGSVRKTTVSKALRDDYTALSQIAISYTMLHATALGMRDASLAGVAESNLNDVAPLIIEISRIMPGVVVRELADSGLDVDTSVGDRAAANTAQAWSGN